MAWCGHLARTRGALARLEEVPSELGANLCRGDREARTIGDRVLAVLELRSASGSPTAPSGFAALFDVEADQILRIGCSSTVSSAPHCQAWGA